jgi:hypothetical protein
LGQSIPFQSLKLDCNTTLSHQYFIWFVYLCCCFSSLVYLKNLLILGFTYS